MLPPITIQYPIRPKKRSLAAGEVCDLFGLAAEEPAHVVSNALELDVRPGDVVLFTGPSGSGKSSLLREVAKQFNSVDAMALTLPEVPLVDALPGVLAERLDLLAAAGLSEARLLLRTPQELSDGQRYRFRIAFALSQCSTGGSVILDEFTAMLDRPLAKVVAFNLRKLATRLGIGILAATTHEDIADDLQPDLHVQCRGEGVVDAERRAVKKKSPQPRRGCLALRRHPRRLGVLRTVALPQPSCRVREEGVRPLVAGSADWHLRLHGPRGESDVAQPGV